MILYLPLIGNPELVPVEGGQLLGFNVAPPFAVLASPPVKSVKLPEKSSLKTDLTFCAVANVCVCLRCGSEAVNPSKFTSQASKECDKSALCMCDRVAVCVVFNSLIAKST